MNEEKTDKRFAQIMRPPGFSNISLRDFALMAPIVHKDTQNHHYSLAILKCIDDLLEVQSMAVLLNTALRNKTQKGTFGKGFHQTMENRIEQLIAEEIELGVSPAPSNDIQLEIKL